MFIIPTNLIGTNSRLDFFPIDASSGLRQLFGIVLRMIALNTTLWYCFFFAQCNGITIVSSCSHRNKMAAKILKCAPFK